MAASILVVEDEALIADDLERTLTRMGYRVPAVVAEGERAVAAAAEDPPSLVLMDIKLRGRLDGIDAARAIQEKIEVPVVFLTSHSDPATLSRASAARPQGYVMKPFAERDLRVGIELALHKHEVERALSAQERWFSTTLRSIGDAVVATDEALSVTFMNRAAEALSGWDAKEARGKGVDVVLPLVDVRGQGLEGPAARALATREPTHLPGAVTLLRRDGTRRLVDDAAAPIMDAGGRALGAVVVLRDDTERKGLEARVARSETLASLGTLAAGLCHEINNPLTSVLANLEMGLELQTEQGELRDCMLEAYEGAARIGGVVKGMRAFAHPGTEHKANADLRLVLDSSIRLTSHVMRQHARLSSSYGAAPPVLAEANRLVQVFVNLLLNAAQAIPEGDASGHLVTVALGTDAAGWALVEVEDDGAGIPADVLPRIFDPFFTTKPPGVGMGLGLSICSSIIDEAGGELRVARTGPGGTAFRVRLPPAQAPAEQLVAARAGAPAVAAARGLVVLVDDEEGVARALARALAGQHEVETCKDGRVALARLRQPPLPDLVLCDLMMPDVTGAQLYEAVLREQPALAARFAFLTGGGTTDAARQFLARTGAPVLLKPFDDLEQFRARVDALLARERPR